MEKWHEKPVLPSGSKEPTCRRHERGGSILRSERGPGGGTGNPLQYSCLENLKDREAWRATVQRSTQLKHLGAHTPAPSAQLQRESSSLPTETALGAQRSVLLSRTVNVTWVKVLASFSTEQSSINCSGSSGPRFQDTHSADGEGDEKATWPRSIPLPTSAVQVVPCAGGAGRLRSAHTDM